MFAVIKDMRSLQEHTLPVHSGGNSLRHSPWEGGHIPGMNGDWDNEPTPLSSGTVLFSSAKAAAAPYHGKDTVSAPSRDVREIMTHSSSGNPAKR